MDILHQLNTKLFSKTINVLKKHEIPFWIDTKSLLSLMGKKMDINLLPNRNVQIGIPGQYMLKLMSLEEEIGFNYRFQLLSDSSGREWIENEYCRLTVLSFWKRKEKAFEIVITPKYKVKNTYRWVDNRSCKEIDKIYYDTLDEISVDGKTFPVPYKVKDYLYLRFGKNWKDPELKWISSINDSVIIENSFLQRIPHKKVINISPLERIQLQKGNYHSRMKDMLLKTIDILNEKKYKYWLEAGTLLGILRDGDLIPWDYDADIGIPAESADDIMKLRLEFFPKYLIKRRIINSPWLPGDMRVIKVKTPWEKIRQINFHVDLFCVYPVENKYRWIDNNALKHVDRKYYDSLDMIEWEGRQINIPKYAEEYLTLRYGNWQVPDQNYDAGSHDGSIAEKGF